MKRLLKKQRAQRVHTKFCGRLSHTDYNSITFLWNNAASWKDYTVQVVPITFGIQAGTGCNAISLIQNFKEENLLFIFKLMSVINMSSSWRDSWKSPQWALDTISSGRVFLDLNGPEAVLFVFSLEQSWVIMLPLDVITPSPAAVIMYSKNKIYQWLQQLRTISWFFNLRLTESKTSNKKEAGVCFTPNIKLPNILIALFITGSIEYLK